MNFSTLKEHVNKTRILSSEPSFFSHAQIRSSKNRISVLIVRKGRKKRFVPWFSIFVDALWAMFNRNSRCLGGLLVIRTYFYTAYSLQCLLTKLEVIIFFFYLRCHSRRENSKTLGAQFLEMCRSFSSSQNITHVLDSKHSCTSEQQTEL